MDNQVMRCILCNIFDVYSKKTNDALFTLKVNKVYKRKSCRNSCFKKLFLNLPNH